MSTSEPDIFVRGQGHIGVRSHVKNNDDHHSF